MIFKKAWVISVLALVSAVIIVCGVSAREESQKTAPQSATAVAQAAASIQPREIAQDLNGDGNPDRWERYENGKLVSLEADSNGDGKIDETGIIENGKLVKIEKDSNFDGKADKWITY